MRTRSSLLASIILHAGLITAALAWTILPEEKEEEIVLKLSLAAPVPAVEPQAEPVPVRNTPVAKSVVQKVLSEPVVEPAPQSLPEPLPTPVSVPEAAPKPVEVAQVDKPVPLRQPVVPTPPLPAPINVEKQYLDDHLSEIRDLLVKYRKYPNAAVRLKQEGSVKVSFRLKQNGEVEDIVVVSGSGHEILDEDAVSLIRKTAGYFPKPPKTVRITVPLNYALRVRG